MTVFNIIQRAVQTQRWILSGFSSAAFVSYDQSNSRSAFTLQSILYDFRKQEGTDQTPSWNDPEDNFFLFEDPSAAEAILGHID